MARTVGSHGPTTLEAIRTAGLKLIYERGYAAMSLRELAAAVGVRVGSLYNHIATKQDLLYDLIRLHMETLMAALDVVLAETPADGDPVERLRGFVRFHVRYHIQRKQEVFIGYSELRSLEPENLAAIVTLRREYEDKLVAILKAGAEAGRFEFGDARVAAYGLLAMITGVCTWFRGDGRLDGDAVAEIYCDMAIKSLAPSAPVLKNSP